MRLRTPAIRRDRPAVRGSPALRARLIAEGLAPAELPTQNHRCDAKDHARPCKYLRQNTFPRRGVQVQPKNLTLIFLPSRAPELNPVENIWQYLRQNWLSNRVFDTYEAIIDAACEAWRKLLAEPDTITSIGMRDWAHIGQR